MRRWWLAGFGLVTLLIWAPSLLFWFSLSFSAALDCTVHEGFPQPCLWAGMDWGPLLYQGFVIGWVQLLTAPLMLLSGLGWLVWGVVRWRAR